MQEGWFGSLLHGSKSSDVAKTSQVKPAGSTDSDVHIKSQASGEIGSLQDAAVVNSTSEVPLVQQKRRTKQTPLSPKAKTRRFEENISFMVPRLGRKPQVKLLKIRKTTWIRTLGVCQTEEELRKLMELTPSWRDMGNRFDNTFSEAFIRKLSLLQTHGISFFHPPGRCIIVKKPELALEIFGNYAKYHVPLSLTGARELLNATYDNQPLSFIIAITSLFDIYKLTPVAQDLPCCAMVVSACLKDGSADALVVAEALVPHLKTVLDEAGPQPIPQTREKGDDMPRVWASWALKKVDESMFKAKGSREGWLRDWRLSSGHITDASQL